MYVNMTDILQPVLLPKYSYLYCKCKSICTPFSTEIEGYPSCHTLFWESAERTCILSQILTQETCPLGLSLPNLVNSE